MEGKHMEQQGWEQGMKTQGMEVGFNDFKVEMLQKSRSLIF